MADASSTYYQPVVDTLFGYLQNINGLTNENRGRLSRLGEVSELAVSIENEKGEVKWTPVVDQCKALVKDICHTLLFGPYTMIITQLSDSFSIVNDMENKRKEEESFKLPKVMQERVVAVNEYLENAKGELNEIDNTLRDLIPKIREAREKLFRVSDREMTDLQMDAEDVKLALDACKKYLDSAEKELNLLESDINSEITTYQMKTAAKVTAVAAGFMIAGALLAKNEIQNLSTKELAQKIGVAGGLAVGASVLGATLLFVQLVTIIKEGKKLLTSHLNILQTKLTKAKADLEVKERKIDVKVTGRME